MRQRGFKGKGRDRVRGSDIEYCETKSNNFWELQKGIERNTRGESRIERESEKIWKKVTKRESKKEIGSQRERERKRKEE